MGMALLSFLRIMFSVTVVFVCSMGWYALFVRNLTL